MNGPITIEYPLQPPTFAGIKKYHWFFNSSIFTVFTNHQKSLLLQCRERSERAKFLSFILYRIPSPFLCCFFHPLCKKKSTKISFFFLPWVFITDLASLGAVKSTLGSKVLPLETLFPDMEKKSSGFFISYDGKGHFELKEHVWIFSPNNTAIM